MSDTPIPTLPRRTAQDIVEGRRASLPPADGPGAPLAFTEDPPDVDELLAELGQLRAELANIKEARVIETEERAACLRRTLDAEQAAATARRQVEGAVAETGEARRRIVELERELAAERRRVEELLGERVTLARALAPFVPR
jgi:hypothetical protein